MNIREALALLVEGQSLSEANAEAVMEQIMMGQATPAQIGGFLIALRLKGETVEEVTGFARAMRRNAIVVRSRRSLLVDTCGTGGDGRGTFNVSTTAAFVIAGAGLGVAKHGNRSVSSKCGSADVLEALGVQLTLSPEDVGACIDEVGIGFLYAPLLHPAMKHAIGPRREMGVRTVFNILGPLTNPAGAQVQVLGVYEGALTEMMARVLGALGSRAAFVVHGAKGPWTNFPPLVPTRSAGCVRARCTPLPWIRWSLACRGQRSPTWKGETPRRTRLSSALSWMVNQARDGTWCSSMLLVALWPADWRPTCPRGCPWLHTASTRGLHGPS